MATLVSDLMTKDFIKVKSSDNLSKLIGQLQKRKKRSAAVYDKGKFAGFTARKIILRSKLDPWKTLIKKFIVKPARLDFNDDLIKAAETLIGCYPLPAAVMRGKNLTGILKPRDLISELKNYPELKRIRASEIMSHKPLVLKNTDRLGDVVSIMHEKQIEHLPVVDRDGKIVSMLSQSDVLNNVLIYPIQKYKGSHSFLGFKTKQNLIYKEHVILDTNIGDISNRALVSAKENETVNKILKKFQTYNINDVVIVKNDKPVGIITLLDLLEIFLRLKKPQLWNVFFSGTHLLKPMQLKAIQEVTWEKFEKIKRAYVKNVIYLLVHIKEYEEPITDNKPKRGRTKYSIRLRLAAPGITIIAQESHFDIMTAIQWALDKLDKELRRNLSKTRQRTTGISKGRRKAYLDSLPKRQTKKNLIPDLPKLFKRS